MNDMPKITAVIPESFSMLIRKRWGASLLCALMGIGAASCSDPKNATEAGPKEEAAAQEVAQEETTPAVAIPNFNGVWVSVLLAFDDPRWKIADLVCARTGCSVEGYAYLEGLLADPANKNRTTKQLVADMEQFQIKANETLLTDEARRRQAEFDPTQEASLDCKPDGDDLRHQITAPLPMKIEQLEDRVIIHYEYWNAVRTVYLGETTHPENGAPSRLGHSIGHYEGNTLVVETAQMIPSVTGIPNDKPLMLSPDAKAVEHYKLAEDGQSLEMMMEIIDPAVFTTPLQLHRRMILEPDWELDTYECESITGEE